MPMTREEANAYQARHDRVRSARGRARQRPCAHCAEKGIAKAAHDWATVHGTDGADVWNDYIPLCKKCHSAYDGYGHHVPHTEAARAKMSKGQRRAYAEGERVGANPYQSGKTQCDNEHEYTPENTYRAPDGTRACKECRRENVRRWRRKQRGEQAS